MYRMMKGFVATAVVALTTAAANAAPVDLTGWVAEGNGTWNLQAGNNAVLQTQNGSPTVFHNNSASSQGSQLSGTIRVQTTGDDDFIGFVLGYHAGDLGNGSADYLLVDWKQNTQGGFSCSAPAGLAISHVTGPLGNDSGGWCHAPANNVTELARATNLGSTGWADNTTYTFDLVFTPTLVQVKVNDALELSVAGSFPDGGFGFYNYSQAQVLYAGIEETAVPAPAGLLLMGPVLGLAGLTLRRRRTA